MQIIFFGLVAIDHSISLLFFFAVFFAAFFLWQHFATIFLCSHFLCSHFLCSHFLCSHFLLTTVVKLYPETSRNQFWNCIPKPFNMNLYSSTEVLLLLFLVHSRFTRSQYHFQHMLLPFIMVFEMVSWLFPFSWRFCCCSFWLIAILSWGI